MVSGAIAFALMFLPKLYFGRKARKASEEAMWSYEPDLRRRLDLCKTGRRVHPCERDARFGDPEAVLR